MSIVPRDWAEPFLAQAREDLRVAWAIPADCRSSTFCMLLQMIFEKLAKAAYARTGCAVPHTHKVASHLFAVLLRHPSAKAIQPSVQVKQFIVELEEANPSVAAKHAQPCPQLEYPWADFNAQQVFYPEQNLSLAARARNPQDRIALDCLKFASSVEKQLFAILP